MIPLEHLRQQLPTMSDLQFHRELTLLVNRCATPTQYTGPWKVKDPVASLPFLVEPMALDDPNVHHDQGRSALGARS